MAEQQPDAPGPQASPAGRAQPVVNIVGARVALGPLRPEQYEAFNRWENDPVVMRTWEVLPRPRTLAKTTAFYTAGFIAEPTSDWFALYERATWRLIGYTGLIAIDHVNRTAEFGILIGEADARGRGYGTEATTLVLDHAFLALGLSNVLLRVFAYNLAGIRAYEKAGFRRMGVRHKSKLMGGRLWDTVYMEALADEFASPVLGRVLVPDRARE
jgi:RimJ/RimL family protein N-acetyltransferase